MGPLPTLECVSVFWESVLFLRFLCDSYVAGSHDLCCFSLFKLLSHKF